MCATTLPRLFYTPCLCSPHVLIMSCTSSRFLYNLACILASNCSSPPGSNSRSSLVSNGNCSRSRFECLSQPSLLTNRFSVVSLVVFMMVLGSVYFLQFKGAVFSATRHYTIPGINYIFHTPGNKIVCQFHDQQLACTNILRLYSSNAPTRS